MKTKYVLFAATFAAAASLFGDAPAAAPRVNVIFDHPENFTDVKETSLGSEKGRDYILSRFKEYLEQRAPSYLALGQTLTVTFTDIDLAGEFEPQRGPNFNNVRIVKEIYPPRLRFTYKLTDTSGAVVKQGEERLTDMSYLMTASPVDTEDSLRYEKPLLKDWLSERFARPKNVTADH